MSSTWRNLVIGIFLSTLIMVFGVWLIHNDIKSQNLKMLHQQHIINRNYIQEFKNTQTQVLTTLAHDPDVCRYNAQKSSNVSSLFYSFLKSDKEIMQLRFIDTDGNEKIRIDRLPDGTIRHTPKTELQNKADRYYFQQFMRLNQNTVGFSEFDLNIENGKVDIPFNPTLRAGIPVYHNGIKNGIIVINYYMDDWIRQLKRYNASAFFIVDSEGYFLVHTDPLWSWSKYHTVPKKATEFFHLSPSLFVPLEETDYRWINDNTVAFSLDLYGQKLLALYQPKVSPNELLIRRLVQFGFIILLSLMFIVIPLIGIIRDDFRRIEEEKNKNEAILIHQSKLDAMGDMLGAIAHQWRQPLNSIGLIIQDIVSAFKYGELNNEYLKTSEKGVMEQLQFMSQTIDAFRNFFTDDKKEEACNLIEIVNNIHTLYQKQLNEYGISLEILCENTFEEIHPCQNEEKPQKFNLNSHPALIKQILLSLITNAKEAIISAEHTLENRTITLTLYADSDTFRIDISDRAGGIDPLITERIFEPYFTTKEIGTGLGLTIAHTLTKRHLKGNLIVRSDMEKGITTFTITLPRSHADEEKYTL